MLASFDRYMSSEPRATLSLPANDGTGQGVYPLNPNDAGNWTGCQVGVGVLVGTYRDWSACAEAHYLGYVPTVAQMRSITLSGLKDRMRPIWNSIGAGQLTDQDVANIYMHSKLHYGNVRIAQAAMNEIGESLSVDGVAGPLTIEAITRNTQNNPVKTYNAIRDKLKDSYMSQYSDYPGFIIALDRDFPRKEAGVSSNSNLGLALLIGGVLVYGFFAIGKR